MRLHPRPTLEPKPPGEPLTSSETRILQVLLGGTLDPLPALMAQLRAARVLERVDTEWGPWIDFWVSPDVPKVRPAHFDIGDVDILFDEFAGSGGAVLFVREGVIASLEILAPVPLDFHVRKVRFERMLEHPTDPDGEPQFVVVERRAIDQIAAIIQEAREREQQRGITTA